MNNCKICDGIIELENNLNNSAELLTIWVIEVCKPVDAWNNQLWIKFAKSCNFPFVGKYFQQEMVMPKGLEKRPLYYNDDRFIKFRDLIEEEAIVLEHKKAAHMEHWGEEIVRPMDPSDPGGYYTPRRSPRRDCYEHGLTPSLPMKFDFSSAAGSEKFNVDVVVMCSSTRRIVPINSCDWKSKGQKIKYTLGELNKYHDPTIPGFNEWRDDAKVLIAKQQKVMFKMFNMFN